MKTHFQLLAFLFVALLLTGAEALAQSPNGRKLLVIHLRGGADPLSILQPVHGKLAERRPVIYGDPEDLLMLPARSGYLGEGFHPRIPILKTLFDNNELSIIRKVGYGSTTILPDLAYLAATHGAADLNQIPPNGWLQRLATSSTNIESAHHAWDFSWERESFAGGGLMPVSLRNFDSLTYYERDDYRDVPFRMDTAFSLLASWGTKDSSARTAFLQAGHQAGQQFDFMREKLGTVALPPTGSAADRYPGNSAGYALRDAEYALLQFPSKVVFTEIRGFDTDSNQRETLYYLLAELNGALTALRNRLIAANRWSTTAILITTESGRGINQTGSPADYSWQNPYGIGTQFGGVFDVYVTGGAARAVRTESYVRDDVYAAQAPQNYHILDIYSALLKGLGYSGVGVIPAYTKRSLTLLK